MELLMRTIHGSHLYGYAHAGSDLDYFEVYTGKRKMRQTIHGELDTTRVSLDQFLKGVGVGVPQYLEALYSPYKDVNRLDYLHIVPGYSATVSRYLRTIKSFWREDTAELKLRRHSARLAWNLEEFMSTGRIKPNLSQEARDWCDDYAAAALGHWRL